MTTRKIVLKSHLALGDIVCLSAVPRDIQLLHPGQFEIAMDTPFPQLFDHNPHVVGCVDKGSDGDKWAEWEVVECHYSRDPVYSVNRSNQNPVHLLTSYAKDVGNSLGINLYPTSHMGDIHLSREEYSLMSPPHQNHNVQRYWVLSLGGGKRDFTTKWYVPEYVQKIVDYFRGRIQFVQVGMPNDSWHWQPDLKGVIDLRGQTDVRQLIRIVHAACGVLSGITSLMHLAAAVPLPTWQRRPRPCVVVAGGREPRTWYSYPTHRVLESVGTMPCCREGGCWHARTIPLNDGSDCDNRLCERVIGGHPKCMAMIRPESVIMEIERYLDSEGIE